MMDATLLHAIRNAIRAATGVETAGEVRPALGGCIHASYVVAGAPPFFVKVNTAEHADVFEAEADGLRALAAAGSLRVPRAITRGTCGERCFLVLEFVPMQPGNQASWTRFGEQLAALHRQASPDGRFGWHRPNYIGATRQPNARCADWIRFWREERLSHQFKLAADRGVRFTGAERLLNHLDAFFPSHAPVPSLLHGDLWSGNVAFTDTGEPVIFDPACYYGDRECDLAFTELFGGFPKVFYEAYDAAWPRDEGWRARRDLYNLYHVLNHDHLFGDGYRSQAQRMIHSLNANI